MSVHVYDILKAVEVAMTTDENRDACKVKQALSASRSAIRLLSKSGTVHLRNNTGHGASKDPSGIKGHYADYANTHGPYLYTWNMGRQERISDLESAVVLQLGTA